MGPLRRVEKISRKERYTEGRIWVCELCGTEWEMEPESGEFHCPVCDNPEG